MAIDVDDPDVGPELETYFIEFSSSQTILIPVPGAVPWFVTLTM